jgi:predicted peptidase
MAQDDSDELTEFERHIFFTVDDQLRYRLLRPDSIEEGKQYPLVIFFHGTGERGDDNEASLKHIAPLFLDEKNREDYPAFVMVPQCPKDQRWTYPGWYAEPKEPMSTAIELIDSLLVEPGIDTTRIYITGLSMGGFATWYLITRYPNKFAAAVPICGGGDWSRVRAFAHMPIWAFHGREDDIIPVEQSRNMIRAIKKAGGKPRYTEYRKVKHDSWEKAYKESELLSWMFSQKKL